MDFVRRTCILPSFPILLFAFADLRLTTGFDLFACDAALPAVGNAMAWSRFSIICSFQGYDLGRITIRSHLRDSFWMHR